jgi:uncharacterized protein (DUF983 family)
MKNIMAILLAEWVFILLFCFAFGYVMYDASYNSPQWKHLIIMFLSTACLTARLILGTYETVSSVVYGKTNAGEKHGS